MNESVHFPIIATIHSPFKEKFGIPRQPNLVDVPCYIKLLAPYNDKSAFEGIEAFSHLWLLWVFHDNKKQQSFKPQVRPPRLGGNQKIGVFATRSMYRPANIGLSVVKLVSVEQHNNGIRLCVQGSDLLDGTPILDIKPYISYSDAIIDAKSGYAVEAPLLKQVFWHTEALNQRTALLQQHHTSEQELKYLEQVLALDPKPAYQQDIERVYGLRFSNLEVKFKVKLQDVFIVNLQYVGLG
ncbi:tRNA (N6-threonylcarbamoyladenosine(37)-N6)-methyltransferase TrmO [Acinetobacter rathckeae]|uniref:tRNA (N6-threonylcarbamoyladenosine(37)-N6)-methyltransferase TrmO n=1 Tax=Acinetobacter rathckeae TaxID=2605272 RepID=UPI0018A32BB2|nr:tRNA (N6-threonylcarbamoyladenosine(37)-N6)-methyltransferase TrmO [Acinetobacter rathckeae]MBF7694800.1 tRNA (N6-threonylcarbamoyladenosine(37)-N6)-methyltransferase TrmO [Acinetobacter rathckeae]